MPSGPFTGSLLNSKVAQWKRSIQGLRQKRRPKCWSIHPITASGTFYSVLHLSRQAQVNVWEQNECKASCLERHQLILRRVCCTESVLWPVGTDTVCIPEMASNLFFLSWEEASNLFWWRRKAPSKKKRRKRQKEWKQAAEWDSDSQSNQGKKKRRRRHRPFSTSFSLLPK